MKVIKKILPLISISFIGFCVIGCASKPLNSDKYNNTTNLEKAASENEQNNETVKKDTNHDSSNEGNDSYYDGYIEEDEVITVDEPTPEEVFLFGLNDVSIKFTEVPKIANINRAFSSAYTVIVTKDETPVSDFAITVSYPSARNLNDITYSTIDAVTDENGYYTFTPSTPDFAVNTKITVYPTPVNDSEELLNASLEHKAQADWKVKSNIISKGAVLFIWDYNERNRVEQNSYNILSELRKRGMTMVGNAPVNESSYIGSPLSTLYKENYEIIEDAYGYLICGTVKFTKPVEACDGGYLCSLIADIQAVNMKNGKKVFDSSFTHEAIGANWTKCVTKCKEELAEEIVDALIYGL